MSAPPPACPRCRETLHAAELKGAAVLTCATCHGTRVESTRLTGVLEAMSAELLKSFDPDTELKKAADAPTERLACSRCGHEMARDDYCGAGLAAFDRCETCELLWIDAAVQWP